MTWNSAMPDAISNTSMEAKSKSLTGRIEPFVNRLSETGMWLSEGICERILALAGETAPKA